MSWAAFNASSLSDLIVDLNNLAKPKSKSLKYSSSQILFKWNYLFSSSSKTLLIAYSNVNPFINHSKTLISKSIN
jgi:hypothetical protein